jgi:5-formyltetrahydrofolate cyclo-ligase
MTKAELRKIFLAKRKEIPADERRRMSQRIADNFFDSFDLTAVRNLHSFIPIEKFGEVDTMLIIRRVWSDFPHVRTFAPRINHETHRIQNVAFSAATEMVETGWGINEPKPDEIAADSEIDIVVTPGLAFDKSLHRVGYGKGYYDRFLGNCRPDCPKVGVSFFEPVGAIDDIHEGDVRLDLLVTPTGVIAAEG